MLGGQVLRTGVHKRMYATFPCVAWIVEKTTIKKQSNAKQVNDVCTEPRTFRHQNYPPVFNTTFTDAAILRAARKKDDSVHLGNSGVNTS